MTILIFVKRRTRKTKLKKKTDTDEKGLNINSGNLGAEEERNNEFWEELIAYFP
jgi:hypothetical protein